MGETASPDLRPPSRADSEDYESGDEDLQLVVVADALRPVLLNSLRNLFYTTAARTRTLEGLRSHIRHASAQSVAESEFCHTVANMLSHGVALEYIQHAMDEDESYSDEYKHIFAEWVQLAALRTGHAHPLLAQPVAPPPATQPPPEPTWRWASPSAEALNVRSSTGDGSERESILYVILIKKHQIFYFKGIAFDRNMCYDDEIAHGDPSVLPRVRAGPKR